MAESPREAGAPPQARGIRIGTSSTIRPARQSLLAGAGWVALGAIGSRIVTVGAMIGVARLLGKDAFGQLGMVQQSVMLCSGVISYGLGLTAAKHLAELHQVARDRAGHILAVVVLASLGLAMLTGAIIVAASPMLSGTSFGRQLLFQPLAWTVLWMIVSSVSLTMQGALTGMFAFRATAWVQLVESLCGGAGVLVGSLCAGLDGVVVGYVAASTTGCLVSCWSLKTYAAEMGIALQLPAWRDVVQESSALRDYGLPMTLTGLVMSLSSWASPALLVWHSGGYSEIAVFNAANYWFNALVILPNILQRVGTVMQAAALGQSDVTTGRKIYRDTVLFNVVLTGAAACPLALASPWVLALFGPEFRGGWPTMVVCLASAICVSVVKPAEQSLTATGRTWTILGLLTGFATIYVLASALLAPFGAFGMATARLGAYALHTVWMSAAARTAYPKSQMPRDVSPDPSALAA